MIGLCCSGQRNGLGLGTSFFATRSSLGIMIYHIYKYIIYIYIYIYIHTYICDILSLAKKGNEAKATEGPVWGEPFGSPQLGLSQRFEHGLLCGEAAGQGDGWPLNEEKTKTPG